MVDGMYDGREVHVRMTIRAFEVGLLIVFGAAIMALIIKTLDQVHDGEPSRLDSHYASSSDRLEMVQRWRKVCVDDQDLSRQPETCRHLVLSSFDHGLDHDGMYRCTIQSNGRIYSRRV
jgi:hypothetical protein